MNKTKDKTSNTPNLKQNRLQNRDILNFVDVRIERRQQLWRHGTGGVQIGTQQLALNFRVTNAPANDSIFDKLEATAFHPNKHDFFSIFHSTIANGSR